MSAFETRLNQARNGRGILFCGAGFSADCLNFSGPEEIGTGAHLLNILNSELKKTGKMSGFRDLKNAADHYKQEMGEHGLMNLLCSRFDIKNVSADMVDILRFPWERIYTTNYDNGIEMALQNAGIKVAALNNLESPHDILSGTTVIHLHGYIKKWDIKSFNQSCILGAESYHLLGWLSHWLEKFRVDVERAEFVAFVGFNASDFHLNQVLFNASGLQEKIFFINRPTAEPDPDVRMTQARFGQPKYIGRQGFAERVNIALAADAPKEPSLASFLHYKPSTPSSSVPKVQDIEDLFIFGKIIPEHLARDTTIKRSDYHVLRSLTEDTLEKFNRGFRLLLITGEICDGKSMLIEEVSSRLSFSRPVFVLRHPYDDLIDEMSRILHTYPNAAFVMENCFDIRNDRLGGIASMVHGSNGILLLSSRVIAAEAEGAKLENLRTFSTFIETPISKLNESEIEALIVLIDQIAGWRNFDATSKAEKARFIGHKCGGSLPAFMLRLLKSDYVIKKYKEEYNKSESLTKREKNALIAALYVAHIGHESPIDFLSNALHFDVGLMLDRFHRETDALKLVRRRGEYAQTIPAIGATNILEHMIPDREIVDCVLTLLEFLAENSNHDDFEKYIFGQFMRYSILRSVVSDMDEINRFFDRISKIEYFRRQVLFWLQWHMAKTDLKDFVDAWKYLEQGYHEADEYDKRNYHAKYDRKQLDDRKAKFLMLRDLNLERQPTELFRDMRDAGEIIGRLLRRDSLTRYPFQTLETMANTFAHQSHRLIEVHRELILNSIQTLYDLGKKRLPSVPDGYQRSVATKALETCKTLALS